jgi:hypothetical protein
MEPVNLPALEDSVAFEYILLGDLRDLLEEGPDDQNRQWLAAVLDALIEAVPQEIELRSREGYLNEVIEQFPNWAPQVDRLKSEKLGLYARLKRLRENLDQPRKFAVVKEKTRAELREWMTAFTAHHRHERRVVQDAFMFDIGGGD